MKLKESVKFKTGDQSVLLETRKGVILGGWGAVDYWARSGGKFLGCGNGLRLDLGADYTGVLSLGKLRKLCIFDVDPFSCVLYFKNFKQSLVIVIGKSALALSLAHGFTCPEKKPSSILRMGKFGEGNGNKRFRTWV